MREGLYYIIKEEFFIKFEERGSTFKKNKNQNRPTFCCVEDETIKGLYWAIPTSNGEKTEQNIHKVENAEKYCGYDDIRGSYYHIGRTNRRAIFCISSAFPITDKYVFRTYNVCGEPLEMKREGMKKKIKDKLKNILLKEADSPNCFESHITDIKDVLIKELNEETKERNTIELESYRKDKKHNLEVNDLEKDGTTT